MAARVWFSRLLLFMEEAMQKKLVDVLETAVRLGVSPRSIIDRRYRLRIGLHGVHVGRRLLFDECEIDRLIERGRESLPGEARR